MEATAEQAIAAVNAAETSEADVKAKKPNAKNGKRRSGISNRRLKEIIFAYGMLLLPLIQFAIFYIWINANSIMMAFQSFFGYADDGGELFIWSMDNFTRLFKELGNSDAVVHIALINTMKYFAAGLCMIPVSFLVAYFLYKKVWGFKFFRVMFFLPAIISAVLFVATYKQIISYGGPLDKLLTVFGLRMPNLLGEESRVTGTIIAYTVWTGLGVNMLLYQSAMSRIPQEVIEAGMLDGVPWWRELFQIIIPMVWPTISTTLILVITSMFNSTGPILLFFGAGDSVDNAAHMTISFWIYNQTSKANLNYPATVGVFFTLVSVPIVFLVRWALNKVDPQVTY